MKASQVAWASRLVPTAAASPLLLLPLLSKDDFIVEIFPMESMALEVLRSLAADWLAPPLFANGFLAAPAPAPDPNVLDVFNDPFFPLASFLLATDGWGGGTLSLYSSSCFSSSSPSSSALSSLLLPFLFSLSAASLDAVLSFSFSLGLGFGLAVSPLPLRLNTDFGLPPSAPSLGAACLLTSSCASSSSFSTFLETAGLCLFRADSCGACGPTWLSSSASASASSSSDCCCCCSCATFARMSWSIFSARVEKFMWWTIWAATCIVLGRVSSRLRSKARLVLSALHAALRVVMIWVSSSRTALMMS
mmetsp:Transcript_29708/g.47938  ORF Transcript_29708/g.47938 Transcript_29708/m.47938 type:complete len:306 (+) Transcript_29708:177-1094(+)